MRKFLIEGYSKFAFMFLFSLVLVTASLYAYRNWFCRSGSEQPIAFNHRAHVTNAQIECSECHTQYAKGRHSGLPAVEVCMACHAEALTKSAEETKLRELVAQGQPVVFRKLFSLPGHVYYSHRRHVALGKLECVRCHGEIAGTQKPPQRPLINISMQFCMDCHTEAKASNDCNACHR